MPKTVCILVCLLSSTLLYAAPKPKKGSIAAGRLPAPAFAAMQTIDPERIRAHVRFLADDLLEGRGTGQRGGDIAAEYIATQFALYGLKPAGDNGTYLQKVPMVGVTTLPESTFTIVANSGQPMNLKLLDDYVTSNQTQQPQSDINTEIVYVGYGIEAPEYNWDDYKSTDVKGKVLLMLRWLSKPCLNGSAQLASDCNGNVCHLEISLAEFEAPHTFADRPNQKSDANQRKNQDGQSLGIFQVSLLGNEICTRKGDQNPEQSHRPRTLHGSRARPFRSPSLVVAQPA